MQFRLAFALCLLRLRSRAKVVDGGGEGEPSGKVYGIADTSFKMQTLPDYN